MAITVKKLIEQLEKIENKFLEVEILVSEKYLTFPVEGARKANKKVFIFTEEPKRDYAA